MILKIKSTVVRPRICTNALLSIIFLFSPPMSKASTDSPLHFHAFSIARRSSRSAGEVLRLIRKSDMTFRTTGTCQTHEAVRRTFLPLKFCLCTAKASTIKAVNVVMCTMLGIILLIFSSRSLI